MSTFTKAIKSERCYFADDGAKRGPMTMFRVRFHPRDEMLLAQCVDRRLALWSLAGELETVKGRREPCVIAQWVCPHEIGWIRGFDVHPGGGAVATGGSDRMLRIWDWRDGRPSDAPTHHAAAHAGWVESVAYSPDGARLATAGADGLVKVWQAADLRPVATLEGHTAYACDVAYSADGRWLVSGGEDGLVIVRDAATWAEAQRIDFGSANRQFGQTPRHSGVHRLAISHDSRWLAVAGGEKLHLYDLASGQQVAAERSSMDVAFHGAALLLAGGESETKLWSCAADKLAPPEVDANGRPSAAAGAPGQVLASIKRGDWSLGLAFSPAGDRLALGRGDGGVELWELS